MKLHAGLARRAIDEYVATPLGLSVEEAAEGIKTIIDARMADLIRQATVEQGYDRSDSCCTRMAALGRCMRFSYGAELGIRKVMVPVTASVHSAFGIGFSDLTVAEEMSAPILSPPGTTDYSTVIKPEWCRRCSIVSPRAHSTGCVRKAPISMLSRPHARSSAVSLSDSRAHHPGTGGEAGRGSDRRLGAAFIDTYQARFGKGSAFTAAGIELTTYGVVAGCDVARPELRNMSELAETGPAAPSERQVHIQGRWRPARVLLPHHLRSAPVSMVSPSSRCRTPP